MSEAAALVRLVAGVAVSDGGHSPDSLASLAKYNRDPAPGPSQLSDTTRFSELPRATLKGLTKSFDLTIKLLLIQHMIVYSVIG